MVWAMRQVPSTMSGNGDRGGGTCRYGPGPSVWYAAMGMRRPPRAPSLRCCSVLALYVYQRQPWQSRTCCVLGARARGPAPRGRSPLDHKAPQPACAGSSTWVDVSMSRHGEARPLQVVALANVASSPGRCLTTRSGMRGSCREPRCRQGNAQSIPLPRTT